MIRPEYTPEQFAALVAHAQNLVGMSNVYLHSHRLSNGDVLTIQGVIMSHLLRVCMNSGLEEKMLIEVWEGWKATADEILRDDLDERAAQRATKQ